MVRVLYGQTDGVGVEDEAELGMTEDTADETMLLGATLLEAILLDATLLDAALLEATILLEALGEVGVDDGLPLLEAWVPGHFPYSLLQLSALQ